jgi:adenylate cyclase
MNNVKDKRGILILTLLIVFTLIWIQLSEIPLLSDIRTKLESIIKNHRVVFSSTEWNKDKSDIVIIDIDRKSIDQHGAWPWHRDKMAHLVNRIVNGGASVIAFDVVFSEPSHNSAKEVLTRYVYEKEVNPVIEQFLEEIKIYFDHDAAFANRIQYQEVVLGFEFHNRKTGSKGFINSPILSKTRIPFRTVTKASNFYGNVKVVQQASKYAGFINLPADRDGTIRKTPLIMRYGNKLYASLALQTARIKLLNKKISILSKKHDAEHLLAIKVDESIIPIDRHGKIDVTYRGGAGTFKIISANDILRSKIRSKLFDQKIVIIGSSIPYIRPLKKTLAGKSLTSAEIHANIIDAIVNQRLLSRPEGIRIADLLLIITMGLGLALTMPFLSNRSIVFLFSGAIVFWIAYNAWFYYSHLVITSISIPILMLSLIAGLNLLGRFDPAIKFANRLASTIRSRITVKSLEDDTANNLASTTEDHATLLLVGIRNFSTLSESLNAQQLNRLLNIFCNPVSNIILQNKGEINQSLGHAVMSLWPGTMPEHANLALTTSTEIQNKLRELNSELEKKSLPTIEIEIGINTGPVKIRRFNYQANLIYGQTIQTCNTLVDLTSFYKLNCLVAESTANAANSYLFRYVDELQLGDEHATGIYHPLGKFDQLSILQYEDHKGFEEFVSLIKANQLDDARKKLKELIKLTPDQLLYRLYLERLNDLFTEYEKPEWKDPLNRRNLSV